MTSAAEPAPTTRDWIPGQLTHPGQAPTWRDEPSSTVAATWRDGAHPPVPSAGPTLPPELAARFQVVTALPQHGAEADVIRVRDATGQDLVLKLYRPEISPDPDVWRALPQLRTPNLVRVHETGAAAGRSYELM
ncbi:MAG: hypothetical protein LC799_16465, partial [Actinobacteria bacterium]|nr:hypothetical protein [Actinomycetota bacterium]